MLEIVLPYIIGTMIGLGVVGYSKTLTHESEIEVLKHKVADLEKNTFRTTGK